MLVTFANSLNPDQARQYIGSDLDPLNVFLKDFFLKVDFEENQQTIEKHAKFPSKQSFCTGLDKQKMSA